MGQKKATLRPRDVRILEALLVRRVETLDWIHERFFDGSLKRTRNRLGELARAGYLERETSLSFDPGGPREVSIYTPGPAALEAVRLSAVLCDRVGDERVKPLRRSLPHQLFLNRV